MAIDWIAQLGDLSVGIAFAVTFIIGLVLVLRRVIQPFQNEIKSALRQNCETLDRIVSNHLEHDHEERRLTTAAMEKVTAVLEQQCLAVSQLVADIRQGGRLPARAGAGRTKGERKLNHSRR